MEAIDVTLSIRTRSENNLHGNWRAHAARAKSQRSTTCDALTAGLDPPINFGVAQVVLTRLSPRGLDGDNLQGALKAVRDGVTDWMSGGYNLSNRIGGISDRDPRIHWIYFQGKAKPKEYAVRVYVQWEEGMSAFLEEQYAGLDIGTAIEVLAYMCLKCLQVSKTAGGSVGVPMCDHCGNAFTGIQEMVPDETESDPHEPQGG